MPIAINNNEVVYINGVGGINLASDEPNNLPSKKLYNDTYPYIVNNIGKV